MAADSQSGPPSLPKAPTPEGAEPTPKTPFAAAHKIVKVVNLESIQFRSFSAESFTMPKAATPDIGISTSTRFLRPDVSRVEGGFTTRTTLVFQVTEKPQVAEEPGEQATVNAQALLRATIEAGYTFKAPSEVSDEELADFALCYCPFHVWGYWREFVQSSLARLELPRHTVPLFLIAQAPRMVKDQLD
jgi:hypothetical protein